MHDDYSSRNVVVSLHRGCNESLSTSRYDNIYSAIEIACVTKAMGFIDRVVSLYAPQNPKHQHDHSRIYLASFREPRSDWSSFQNHSLVVCNVLQFLIWHTFNTNSVKMQLSLSSLLAVTASIAVGAAQMQINYYSDACYSYEGQVDVTWATNLYTGPDNCYNYHYGSRYTSPHSHFPRCSLCPIFPISPWLWSFHWGERSNLLQRQHRQLLWEQLHLLLLRWVGLPRGKLPGYEQW